MSKIEWTEKTWNPIAGCSDVSEGCRNCYARGMAKRLEAMGSKKYESLTILQGSKTVWTGKIAFDENALLVPLRRKKPTMYFVNSMSDLFHEGVTDEMLDRIFAVMALCPQHTFQVLTKRPARMLAYFNLGAGGDCEIKIGQAALPIANATKMIDWDWDWRKYETAHGKPRWPLPNVWLGVSTEDQKAADERIPLLLQTPAAKRFISAEPLLGPIDLTAMENTVCRFNPLPPGYEKAVVFYLDALRGSRSCVLENCDAREEEDGSIPRLDWVIVGGESGAGPGIRPMHPDWARSLRDQCVAAGVPFFFKQWGEWMPQTGGTQQLEALLHTTPVTLLAADGRRGQSIAEMDGHARFGRMLRVGKKAAGRMLDGREWNEMPRAGDVGGESA